MPGLSHPTPERQIIDLTRRLAEDYHRIPLPEVSRVVKAAAVVATGDDADRWAGTPAGLPAIIDVIEHVAREDLETLADLGIRSAGDGQPIEHRRQRRARDHVQPLGGAGEGDVEVSQAALA